MNGAFWFCILRITHVNICKFEGLRASGPGGPEAEAWGPRPGAHGRGPRPGGPGGPARGPGPGARGPGKGPGPRLGARVRGPGPGPSPERPRCPGWTRALPRAPKSTDPKDNLNMFQFTLSSTRTL